MYAFALKGEHNIYSVLPNIPVCIYILTKSEYISSCSWPAVGSNIVQITSATFFVNVFFKWPLCRKKIDVCRSKSSHFGCPKWLLTISDQYHNFNFCDFFYKMAAGGHFGCSKLTFMAFPAISDQYQTFFFRNFLHNGCRRDSLSIAFLAISNWYATLIFLEIVNIMAAIGHFKSRSHFWPF